MPIIASSGALTYSRTNLGDPNYTYWMIKPTGITTNSVKDLYLDDANNAIYVQCTSSIDAPIICKLDGLVGPTVGYNKTYTVTSPTGTYGLMGYMGYNSTTDELMIPFRFNSVYPGYGNYIVGSSALIVNEASNGVINNNYRRWPLDVPFQTSNNTVYTNTYSSSFNSSQEVYLSQLDAGPSGPVLRVRRYANPSSIDNGTFGINPSPSTATVNMIVGRVIFDSSDNSICETRIYGTNSNDIRWYTNSSIAGPTRSLPQLYSIAFSLASKRLQMGGIVLDSSENRIGAVYNQTDNNGYVIKTSSTQILTWQKQIIGVSLNCVAVDSSDNVYAVGNIGTGLYIVKFNSSGTLQWQRQITSGTSFGAPVIYCDVNDNIYIACLNDGYPIVMKLPNDGSKTGSYILAGATITYASVTQSINPGNLVISTPAATFPAAQDLPYSISISTTAITNNTSANKTPVS